MAKFTGFFSFPFSQRKFQDEPFFLTRSPPDKQKNRRSNRVRILLVVDGQNDVFFLRRISGILNRDDDTLPDLSVMELQGRLIFLPQGGIPDFVWCKNLAPLEIPEFHIYDKERSPETETRQRLVAEINRRSNCIARLTGKRMLENYLHSEVIVLCGGPEIAIGLDDDVPERVAKEFWISSLKDIGWNELPQRAKKRCCNRAKRWLNSKVVEAMTPEFLKQSDPDDEIRGWLTEIRVLSES